MNRHIWTQIRSTGRWLITTERDHEIIRSLAVMDDYGNLIYVY